MCSHSLPEFLKKSREDLLRTVINPTLEFIAMTDLTTEYSAAKSKLVQLFSADTHYIKKKICCCIYYNFNTYFCT